MKKIWEYLKNHKEVFALTVFAIGMIAVMSNGTIYDYDYWFHYRAGEYFFETMKVPTDTMNSWFGQANNLYWMSHEWLFGVLVYWISQTLGNTVIYFLPYIVFGLIVYFVLAYKKEFLNNGNSLLGMVAVFLLISNFMIADSPRPHLFAYIFTLLLFIILREDDKRENRFIYLLVPLNILWVNFHGGSYLLLQVFLFISIVAHLFEFELGKIQFKRSKTWHTLRRILVLGLCIATVVLNGHGIEMYMYPIINMKDTLMQTAISEWSSPDLKVAWQAVLYIPLLLCGCAMISTKKKINALDLLTYGAYSYLFLRSIRFAPQLAIVAVMIMMDYSDAIPKFDQLVRPKFRLLIIYTIGFMFLISGLNNFIERYEKGFDYSKFPTEEIMDSLYFIEPERLYNEYNIGGYLLYRHVDVFIDGRADIYSPTNLQDFLDIMRVKYNTKELIDKYDFDYMLVSNKSELQLYIELNSEDYYEIVRDDGFTLYQRVQNYIED